MGYRTSIGDDGLSQTEDSKEGLRGTPHLMGNNQNEQKHGGKMKRIKILGLVVMVAVLFPNTVPAQPPDTLWTKTYGGGDWDAGHSVAQTGDGGYIIAGMIGYYTKGSGDVYLIRTDANGDTLWTKACGGSGGDRGNSVVQTDDGGYIIAGMTTSYGAGGADVYLIRLGPEGGVEENSNLTVESPNLRLGQNPTSTTTTISYQIPARGEVALSVYDIAGREIKRLADGVQERGNYHLQLDMTGNAQGVYFINLTAGKLRSVKKVIVFK